MKSNNWNYVFAFLAAVFILSSAVSTVYAAPNSPPTLKLVKSVITDDGGSAVPNDWVLFATLPNDFVTFYNQGGSGIFESVPVDTEITLSETDHPAGYLASGWVCNGGEFTAPNKITLSLGDRVTCTITNDDIAPTLKLVKEVIHTNGGTAMPDEWTLSANGSGPNAKRNFSNLGGSGVPEEVFAYAVYNLTESGGNLAYSALNDGKWDCTITYPNGRDINVSGIVGISLSEGDKAICTITNVEDLPTLTINSPSKITGKLTLSATVNGFEDSFPVSFKVYKMDGSELMVYEGYVSSSSYSFSIPAKSLDAGSSYEVRANTTDGNGKSASDTLILNIPAKGNN